MSENSVSQEVKENKKSSNIVGNIILIVIFVSIGIVVGIYGATMFLEDKKNNNDVNEEEIVEGPKDITDSEEYRELAESIYLMINKNSIFYSTKGLSSETIDNASKLTLIYNYLVENKQGVPETLNQLYYGANVCNNNFVLDKNVNPSVTSTVCTINKFDKKLFVEASKKIFNNELLDTSVPFTPVAGVRCVADQNTNMYLCGSVVNESGITGILESKFAVQKVTKDDEGTIVVYDKGYLVDKRSNVDNPNDQYDNYYLHSSDSTNYYYELKSADNLTFKHTFKTTDRKNYYYVDTELVKE